MDSALEPMYKTKGEFLLAKTLNMFSRLDTPEVSEDLDGTLSKRMQEPMTALQATILASRIAALEPSLWLSGEYGCDLLTREILDSPVMLSDGEQVRGCGRYFPRFWEACLR